MKNYLSFVEIGIDDDDDNEYYNEGFRTMLDFGDGFKFVKLVNEEIYVGEFKSLGYDVIYESFISVYSLRDENDKPCCIIWKGKLIENKEEKGISKKYIEYITKFLETVNVHMLESTMKKIGYYKLDNIDTNLSVDSEHSFGGEYVSEGDLEHIKNKNGEQYLGFGLLNVKKLFDINEDLDFKLNFDIETFIKYTVNRESTSISKKSRKDNVTISSRKENCVIGSTGCRTKIGSVGRWTMIGASGSETRISSTGDYSIIGSTGNYVTIGAAGDSVIYNEGHYVNIGSAGDHSVILSKGHGVRIGSAGKRSKIIVTGKYATVGATGEYTQMNIVGEKSVGSNIGAGSIIKGILGTRITLAEYNDEGDVLFVKTGCIDGQELFPDVWYKLENKEFTVCDHSAVE